MAVGGGERIPSISSSASCDDEWLDEFDLDGEPDELDDTDFRFCDMLACLALRLLRSVLLVVGAGAGGCGAGGVLFGCCCWCWPLSTGADDGLFAAC